MDTNLAQSVIVWAALSIGLASVIYCLLSATAAQPSMEGKGASEQADETDAPLDMEEAA